MRSFLSVEFFPNSMTYTRETLLGIILPVYLLCDSKFILFASSMKMEPGPLNTLPLPAATMLCQRRMMERHCRRKGFCFLVLVCQLSKLLLCGQLPTAWAASAACRASPAPDSCNAWEPAAPSGQQLPLEDPSGGFAAKCLWRDTFL